MAATRLTRRALARASGVVSGGGAAGALAACGIAGRGAGPGAGPEATHKAPVTIDWLNTGDTVSDDLVIVNTFERKMKDYRWSAAPLPAGRAGQYSVANSHGMCLTAGTKKKDAAWAFLGWYGSVEGQTAIAENNGVPGLRSVAQKSYLTRPAYAEGSPEKSMPS